MYLRLPLKNLCLLRVLGVLFVPVHCYNATVLFLYCLYLGIVQSVGINYLVTQPGTVNNANQHSLTMIGRVRDSRDHTLSAYAIFPEKVTFLTPKYAHVRVQIRGLVRNVSFQKNFASLRAYVKFF